MTQRLHRTPRGREGRGEEGHTLAETAVALALLVAVLLPLIATTVGVVNRRPAEGKALALLVAQGALEEALAGASHESPSLAGGGVDVLTSSDGRWEIHRSTRREGALVTLHVSVRRRGHDTPAAELSTARLAP